MGHDEGWAGQGVGRRPQQVGVGCSDRCLGIFEYIAIAALIFGDFVPNILIPRVETHTDPVIYCPGTNTLVPWGDECHLRLGFKTYNEVTTLLMPSRRWWGSWSEVGKLVDCGFKGKIPGIEV